ncbi:platelet-activating factor receptor [Lampris incognitus]|uniref:platelet-activating factor receptor n=1 Tax=Lampris incognitus TaxID=2546036 RepID=UPI0024B5075A|nr:platelet-activating factor receptor [Lampris incognitus]XP_056152141.1 platelet-activating factor receptor [Lampris incognitus]
MLDLRENQSFEATEVLLGSLGETGDPTASSNSSFLDSEFRYRLFSISYSVIFILGFFLNCYVLFVLRRLREARSLGEIRIYMTSLTIADFLFVCVLPFWIDYYSRHGDWIYHDFLCRVTGSMFFINTYCSILFLGAISINRYWAVTRPLDAASSDHRCRGIVVTATIWLLTLGASVPFLLNPGINKDEMNVTRCFEGYQRKSDGSKKAVAATHFTIIGLFFIVFFIIVVFNLLIARALLAQSPAQPVIRSSTILSSERKKSRAFSSTRPRGVKRRALQMLCAVVGVFVVCFVPHHIIQGPWTLAVLKIKEGWGSTTWSQETHQALSDAHQITLVLMGVNCILDPVVYFFATRKFRMFLLAHIRKIMKQDSCSNTGTAQISMESKGQSQKLASGHQ